MEPTATSSAEPATVSVLKSDIATLLSHVSDTGVDGEYIWPIPASALALLYRSSSEHGRAIHVKAEGAYGGGLIGVSEPIEALCDTGAAELFVTLGLDLETYGNAFLQKVSDSAGKVIALRRLPAITMARTKTGFLQRIADSAKIEKITFGTDEIVHLREPCPMGRRYALPAWIGAEGMLELAHAATRYNAAFFANSAIPEFAVIFKGTTPTAAQKQSIQEFFRAGFQGVERAHRTLVLNHPEEGEIKLEKLTADVKDADFLKLIDAARDRIPIAHGTPPRILGIVASGQLGGGGEVTGQLFVFERLTLAPKRRRMLDQLRPLLRDLGLVPGDPDRLGENQVAFRPLDLTPPDDDAEQLPYLVQAGILSPEEARAMLPRSPEAAQGAGEARTGDVRRTAPASPADAMAALLARL